VIRAVAGDLASVAADAVARPATTRLEPLTTARRHLDDAAGPRFIGQRAVRRELGVGSAVVTAAGDLPAEFVVHLVLGQAEDAVTTDTVRRAVEAALFQCVQWHIGTLACPIPAAGNLAAEAALTVLLEVLRAHVRVATYPANVLIVTGTAAEADLVNARIGQGTS
jgi:O-acetyl-ADP-ribose deacetylase (regulator of RNase III)